MFKKRQIEQYDKELKILLKDEKIFDLDAELVIYKKNMNLLCDMLSLAEINSSGKRLGITSIQIMRKIIERFSDSDINFLFDLDLNKYAYLYLNYKDKKLEELSRKYDLPMKKFIDEVNFKENSVRDEMINKLLKQRTKEGILNLGSIASIKSFTDQIAVDVINSVDTPDKIKVQILDGLAKEIYDARNFVSNCYDSKQYLEKIVNDSSYRELINKYSEYKKNEKEDILYSLINNFNDFTIDISDLKLFKLIDGLVKFDTLKDDHTDLEISAEAFVAKKIFNHQFNELFESDSYSKKEDNIKENDIVALLYEFINNEFEYGLRKLKEIVSLSSFRLTDTNISIVLGLLEDRVAYAIKESSYKLVDFKYLMNDGMKNYNKAINEILRILYSKIKTTKEFNELNNKVDEFNSNINSMIRKYHDEIDTKNNLEREFSSLLKKVDTKVNEEYDRQYSKINKKLKQVLTVSEVLENKKEGEK